MILSPMKEEEGQHYPEGGAMCYLNRQTKRSLLQLAAGRGSFTPSIGNLRHKQRLQMTILPPRVAYPK